MVKRCCFAMVKKSKQPLNIGKVLPVDELIWLECDLMIHSAEFYILIVFLMTLALFLGS